EVQTDKMVAELTSPCSGVVKKIIIDAGETVRVGTSLIYIEADESVKMEQKTFPEMKQDVKKEAFSPVMLKEKDMALTFNRVLAAPFTRKIARDNNINIEDVPASDPSGRVTEEDVYRFLKGQQPETQKESVVQVQKKAINQETPDEIPFKGIRKKIAEKMTKSLFTIPHVTHFDEVNMTNLFKMREELKASGESVSVSAFLIKALVISLKDFP
ncbi:2-oxo acid dehydrogenase subunit E2, partial [Leptospira santarosai]|nr:2-oxo acid dehydrogenase subunit E2 [Leptospira santarosai]